MPSRPKPSKQAARGAARSAGSARTTAATGVAATGGARAAKPTPRAASTSKTPARGTKAVPAKAAKPAAKTSAKAAAKPAAKRAKPAAKVPAKAPTKTAAKAARPAAKNAKVPAKTAPRGSARTAAQGAPPAAPDHLQATADPTLAASAAGAVAEPDEALEIPTEPSAPEPEPIPEELSPEEWFRREKARRTRPATADVMAEARELLLQAVAEAGPRRGRPVRVGAAAKGKPTKKLAPDEFELEEYRPGEKKVVGET